MRKNNLPRGWRPGRGRRQKKLKNKADKILAPIRKNVNGQAESLPPFRFVDMSPPSGYQRFCSLWEIAGLGVEHILYIRTGIPQKPVGGKAGTIVRLNLETGEMTARYASWPEWAHFREAHNLMRIKGTKLCVEIEIEALKQALFESEVM